MRVELSNVPEHDMGWNICERMNSAWMGMHAIPVFWKEKRKEILVPEGGWMDGIYKKKGVQIWFKLDKGFKRESQRELCPLRYLVHFSNIRYFDTQSSRYLHTVWCRGYFTTLGVLPSHDILSKAVRILMHDRLAWRCSMACWWSNLRMRQDLKSGILVICCQCRSKLSILFQQLLS